MDDEKTTTQPAVLVDVDGVLNPVFDCNKPRETCKCHPDWTRVWAKTSAGRFRLTLNPAHGPLLWKLTETGAELLWASYWQGEANQWVSPMLGLPEDMPHVPIPPRFRDKYSPGAWKAHWVADWAGARPFVWFEDEPDVAEELAELAGKTGLGEYLLIKVDERVGLTEEHVAEAAEWLAVNTSVA